MSDGGKGSTQRPTDQESYRSNWEKIFGKKPEVPNAFQKLGANDGNKCGELLVFGTGHIKNNSNRGSL
jgi:hypothetical protein